MCHASGGCAARDMVSRSSQLLVLQSHEDRAIEGRGQGRPGRAKEVRLTWAPDETDCRRLVRDEKMMNRRCQAGRPVCSEAAAGIDL